VRALPLALALALGLIAPAQAGAPSVPMPMAELQALDKVTARIRTLRAPVGGSVEVGSLTVRVLACYVTEPSEPPESAVFLQIDEDSPVEPVRLFSGWMFASSPGLSALDHPVYDVWLTACVDPSAAAPPAVPSAESEPSRGETPPLPMRRPRSPEATSPSD
jgi:hypothetical protein